MVKLSVAVLELLIDLVFGPHYQCENLSWRCDTRYSLYYEFIARMIRALLNVSKLLSILCTTLFSLLGRDCH